MAYEQPKQGGPMPPAGQPPLYEEAIVGPPYIPRPELPKAPASGTHYSYPAAPPYQQQFVSSQGYVGGQPVILQQPQQVIVKQHLSFR